MDRLPDELVIDILCYLEAQDLINTGVLSRRFLRLSRDLRIWKELCFVTSPAEAARHRRRLFHDTDSNLSALRQAFNTLAEQSDHSTSHGISLDRESNERARALANWDPRGPDEELDFYQEYIHRHAPIAPVTWLEMPRDKVSGVGPNHEATGMGILRNEYGEVSQLVSPLDDGSVAIWTVAREPAGASGSVQLSGRSDAGLLTGLAASNDNKAIMTEVGAVECVAIDSSSRRGLFAIQQNLREVDLETLQIVSCQSYPFSITALSEASCSVPVTVGTSSTIHLYDSRVRQAYQANGDIVRCELIGGLTASHADLTQPGPLSILHDHQDNSIWVAGRFTHLLNYDRRFFPRLRGTVHSGARVSSLSSLPYPHGHQDLDPMNRSTTRGSTLIAAGVYKGKGSLELYGISQPSGLTTKYQNRQTASTSKLLSAVPTNGHLAVSDSDGNVKWFERNAQHRIRTFNINTPPEPSRQSGNYTVGTDVSFNQASTRAMTGLWNTADADLPGQGDIVQKITPFCNRASQPGRGVQNPLFLWTGDGRIGALGFGSRAPFTQLRRAGDGWTTSDEDEDQDRDQDEDEGYVSGYSAKGAKRDGQDEDEDEEEEMRVKARRAERRAREDAERQFAGSMRRALEGQANEARWMRGLGLGG
ncbi:hypothetical protein CAC42_6945 [Sphaceloma murrayae]|uniref:F-box domain-containing protein n=1 Tax=Sphaceloma murrayae TaxID=2082308 RepID=A0A2K1QQE0_9PEZI|nr:hypothetical protein CAC42_6945 [Sphaceloma murrayae]